MAPIGHFTETVNPSEFNFLMKSILPLAFSILVPLVGYYYLGALVGFLFSVGYIGGFVLWLLIPRTIAWSQIRAPYWACLAIFLGLHKVEENQMGFFKVLGEKITGVSEPPITLMLVFWMLVVPMGAWLSIPFLVKRGHPWGTYLAWTYFASFAFVESAHFIFPFLADGEFGYFPGMASALLLVPAGIWGMLTLARRVKGNARSALNPNFDVETPKDGIGDGFQTDRRPN